MKNLTQLQKDTLFFTVVLITISTIIYLTPLMYR
jgi:type III secretory pathway component EscS